MKSIFAIATTVVVAQEDDGGFFEQNWTGMLNEAFDNYNEVMAEQNAQIAAGTWVDPRFKDIPQDDSHFNSFISEEMPVVGDSKSGASKPRRRRAKKVEEPVDLTEPQLVDSPIFWGLDPLLGRNIFSMFITDIINIIVYPCTVSILAWFFDLAAFFLFPFLGGFLGASSFLSFNRDPQTYHYAKLTQIDLYKMGMIFIKDALYSFLGRPTFFDNE